MSRPAITCSVCQRQRSHGSHDDFGSIFVCDECQADATQFIQIQEGIWSDAEETDEPGSL